MPDGTSLIERLGAACGMPVRSVNTWGARLPTRRRLSFTTTSQGVAYTGHALSCPSEPEHGIGLMMDQDRVVTFGDGDTALLEWVAEAARHSDRRKQARTKT